MISILAAYVAPAQYVIPSVITLGLIIPSVIILVFNNGHNRDLENPKKKDDAHH